MIDNYPILLCIVNYINSRSYNIKDYNLDQLKQNQSQPEDGLVGNIRTHQHSHQDGAHFQPSARPLLHRQQQEDRSVATLIRDIKFCIKGLKE